MNRKRPCWWCACCNPRSRWGRYCARWRNNISVPFLPSKVEGGKRRREHWYCHCKARHWGASASNLRKLRTRRLNRGSKSKKKKAKTILDSMPAPKTSRIIFKAGVIDPTKVSRVALENAASVAAMLLTTDAFWPRKKRNLQCRPVATWAVWAAWCNNLYYKP